MWCTILSFSFSNDRANGQRNTVVQGKHTAATSWLCALLNNTTVDNVYIQGKPRVTDWLNESDGATNEMKRFIFMETVAMLSCFSLAKINDSVLDSAYDWLTRLWERKNERTREKWNVESGQFFCVKESFLGTDSFANNPSLVDTVRFPDSIIRAEESRIWSLCNTSVILSHNNSSGRTDQGELAVRNRLNSGPGLFTN